jgi:hypothetical protein
VLAEEWGRFGAFVVPERVKGGPERGERRHGTYIL